MIGSPSAESAAALCPLPRRRLTELLRRCLDSQSLDELRKYPPLLRTLRAEQWGAGEIIEIRRDLFHSQLLQIEQSRTLGRAQHYVRRLLRSLEEVKTPRFSDINLCRWQEYDDLWTDSLWHIERRDRSGEHSGHYWGNFVPQIPHQLMRRFSKAGEWVLDPFLGSGTTLIEARRLGRHGIGIELQEAVAQETWSRVQRQENPAAVQSVVIRGNSAQLNYRETLQQHGISSVQLAILHPPYHDIIRFSEDPGCLSNAPDVDSFIENLAQVVQGVCSVLDRKRFLAVVIGDKYSGSNWVPLGFLSMQRLQQLGLTLKSVIVKNFEDTLGKRQQRELWRYRALAGGFYIFKHEYIFLFQKP